MNVTLCAIALLMLYAAGGENAIDPGSGTAERDPYYYYSEDTPWYDSYGRLRYGPRGIPAEEYHNRIRRERDAAFPRPPVDDRRPPSR